MHHICVILNTPNNHILLQNQQFIIFIYIIISITTNQFYTRVSTSILIHYLLYLSYYNNCKFSTLFIIIIIIFDFSYDDDDQLKQHCPAHQRLRTIFMFHQENTRYCDPRPTALNYYSTVFLFNKTYLDPTQLPS